MGGGVGLQRWVSKITETWVKLEVHRETHHVPKIHGISEYKPTRSYASVYVRLFLTYVQYLAQKPGIFRYNRDMRGFYVEIQIIFATVESYVHGGFII